MSFLTAFGASEAVRHPRIALPPFGGGVSGGVLSSASDEDGGLQGAIRAERAWRARQSNTVPPMVTVPPMGFEPMLERV